MTDRRRVLGRYEVALDGALELRDYTGFMPAERIRSLGSSTKRLSIEFDGRIFTWHPGSEALLPVVTVPITSDDDYHEEREAMSRFLSALSFLFGSQLTIYSSAASSSKKELDPPLLQQPRLLPTIHPVPSVISVPQDADLRLCLALKREGISAASEALRFLSLYKVIEAAIGEDLVDQWIDEQTASDPSPDEGWSRHLRELRNATAHAVRFDPDAPRHDPDDPQLSTEIGADAPLVWRLATSAVRNRWPKPVTATTRRA